MRIRKKEWARPELAESTMFVKHPKENKGKWQEEFSKKQPIHLDLGCGKCVFLADIAYENQDVNYIGIDISLDILGVGRRNIVDRFSEEEQQTEPENVKIFDYNIEKLTDVFDTSDNIERIYINFCNPWPKARGHKKRLTHTNQLENYKKLLKDGAEIWFKTDNDDLYIATKRYFKEANLEVFYETQDLLSDEEISNNTTEHEQKFTSQGIKIKAIRAKVVG